jgi:hypothetical protein
MGYTRFLQLGAAGLACAIALLAADFWKTKDSSQWTNEEVNKLLSDSPWAKEMNVTSQQPGAGQRRGNGTGRRGGGIGYPGGGVGFPGGGYPGGGYPGGGYPGGGGGYPRGGGYPGGSPGGGGYPDDTGNYPGGRVQSINVTLRWESALPVQQALMRQGGLGADESKPVADASAKDYVISVLGFRMPERQDRLDDNDGNANQDRLRSQFLDAAQLIPKGKRTIYAEDVKFEGPDGSGAIRFLFPRTNAISAGDKEVDFIFEVRGTKLEHKFRLADMQYQGQLAL